MKKNINPIRAIFGIFFIILGILGLLFPVMPGWIFIFVGLGMFSPELNSKMKKVNRRYNLHKRPVKTLTEIAEAMKETYYKPNKKFGKLHPKSRNFYKKTNGIKSAIKRFTLKN